MYCTVLYVWPWRNYFLEPGCAWNFWRHRKICKGHITTADFKRKSSWDSLTLSFIGQISIFWYRSGTACTIDVRRSNGPSFSVDMHHGRSHISQPFVVRNLLGDHPAVGIDETFLPTFTPKTLMQYWLLCEHRSAQKVRVVKKNKKSQQGLSDRAHKFWPDRKIRKHHITSADFKDIFSGDCLSAQVVARRYNFFAFFSRFYCSLDNWWCRKSFRDQLQKT